MSIADYLIEGLEKWLEVERERGVRTLEVDRSLLADIVKSAKQAPDSVTPAAPKTQAVAAPQPVPKTQAAPAPSVPRTPPPRTSDGQIVFAFLHDRPLDAAGQDMIAKIVSAMGFSAEDAPVVTEHPVPAARAYVVLGSRALKKFFPETKAEPGQWIKSTRGKDVLVTYSPAFLLRFPTVTESVHKMKQSMWLNLKDLMRRLK